MKKEPFTVVNIDEADFGCEGRPEGMEPMDEVILRDRDGREMTRIVRDRMLCERKIEEGDSVFPEEDGTLRKAETPDDLSDRALYDTPIGPVCMSKTEYEKYMEKREEQAIRRNDREEEVR